MSRVAIWSLERAAGVLGVWLAVMVLAAYPQMGWAQEPPPQETGDEQKDGEQPPPEKDAAESGTKEAGTLPSDEQKPAEGEQPETREKPKKLQIDPELQKKIDQMFEAEAAQRAAEEGKRGPEPGKVGGVRAPRTAQERTPKNTAPRTRGKQPTTSAQPSEPTGQPPEQPATGQAGPEQPQPGQPQPGQPQPRQPRASKPQPGQPMPAQPQPGQPSTIQPPPMQPPIGLPPVGEPGRIEPVRAEPQSPSTILNIPPADSGVPPEERRYVFSIKNGTYEQLVEGFARQTGLGVMGEAPKDGQVTFVSTQELTFLEALSRIRMLLFNYKPTEPYWLERHDTHLKVKRVNDIYRELGPERMFKSVDEFRSANLSEDELALVVYTPKSGSLADLRVVRDFLPDYVRVTPLEDKNAVTIFALVKDIEKYLELIDFFRIGSTDPRTTERIEIRYLLRSEALSK